MRRNKQLFNIGIMMMAAAAICLATTPAVFAEMFAQSAKLYASDGTSGMNYGSAAGISGNTIVVGATDTATGAAYVYTKGGSGWGSEVKLDLADWTGIDDFGNGAAIDGNTIIIGANKSTVGSVAGAGTAHIYGSDGMGGWTEVALLTAGTDATSDIGFGTSVAISGDIALVGASKYDGASGNQGATYVFGRDVGGTNNWGLITKLTASDPSSNAYFGAAMAIDGDTAVIGAYNISKAYIFEDDGLGNWSETTKITSTSGTRYGAGVSIDGDTVVSGAYYRSVDGKSRAGWAEILSRDEGGEDTWGQVSEIASQNVETYGYFGRSVATDSGLVVAGAYGEDTDSLTDSGAAYVFQDDGSYLEMLLPDDAAESDSFGKIVAISGTTIVVTATGANGFDTDAGAVYIFEVPEPSTLVMVIGLVTTLALVGYRRRS
ncbi:MAG: FG-GAP repeat protein [Pirellulales bacterium]|nr:FG-GAP repeat protein [Pirellulales bacterium]